MKRLLHPALTIIIILLLPGTTAADRIQPSDLIYQGAFRLPGPGGDSGWGWSGSAMTYYPAGDPNGPDDSYPGSLFGTGHDWYQYVSEISIPVPVLSPGKDINELNTASTLQPFSNIRGNLFGEFEIPRVGLEYLIPQGAQATGKLYFCWTQHLQTSPLTPTHGWCDLNLSAPLPAGPWFIEDYDNYSTTDYIFSIPETWADTHLPGKLLATGRFRDGGQGGQGPSIFAYAPWEWGNPPLPQSTLPAIPLLLYSTAYWEDPHQGLYKMNGYHHSDAWTGAAWLTAGNKSAVIFVGTKGRGDCWYGCADGTDEPPWPEDCDRGWWSTYFDGEIIFYDPDDLAAVAAEMMEPYEPQPYARMNIDHVLYHLASSQQWEHVNAAAFDRSRGLLYVFEPLADGDKPLVHVWEVEGSAPSTPCNTVCESGDYNGDGTDEIAVFRPVSGLWATRGVTRAYFGGSGDIPVPGDWDGNETTETGIFRDNIGLWAIRKLTRTYFGSVGDRPFPGDYNGNGKCDAGIFREASGLWAVKNLTRVYFGRDGDLPIPGDYTGDGTVELGVFRGSSHLWAIRGYSRFYFGDENDIPMPGDYNGDGTREAGIFRPAEAGGLWAIREVTRFYFGSGFSWLVPADYTGNRRDDIGIFRDTTGLWSIRGISRVYFGAIGDIPATR
ncbi:MAG: hypothetical protein RAO92_06965 [Candidatus Euphemobacter frigidus]|nr:hypothetical protein [Candidatus Euphemobacter frigidus]MDP8276127.1 hypothetical protein [Candidatus Euphemobacter frigidus]